MTSREEEDLTALGEFKCVNIKSLKNDEAYDLIRKYDNNGETSKKLIQRLEGASSMGILHEFLSNPLLVSLLYKTFEYKEEIPYKKIGFYNQVYDALFNDHDKTKGSAYIHEKKTNLDKYQFEQVLRAFGFLSLKSDKIEYSSQLICQLLDYSIKRYGWLKIKTNDLLYDITHAVPFIHKDGNEYRWVHKSFMEYFASCFICYDNKGDERKYFNKMISIDFGLKYYNVLNFCYELDTLGFRKYVIYPYIKNYVNTYNKCFQNPYFKQFDEVYLNIARSWLSLDKKIYIFVFQHDFFIKTSWKDLEMECRNYLKRFGINFADTEILQDDIVIVGFCNIIDSIITDNMKNLIGNFKNFYVGKLMKDRINKKLNAIIESSCENIKGVFEINDDLNNPINKDKILFDDIIQCTLKLTSYNNNIYNYEKCVELVNEIESEIINISNDIFEL